MDQRFDVPIFTLADAARHLQMSISGLRPWGDGLITMSAARPQHARVSFMSFAEAQFIRRLRQEKLTMPAIRAGVDALRREFSDVRSFLLRDRLAHDGVDLMVKVLAKNPEGAEWLRARDGQAGLRGVVETGLRPVSLWGDDDLPMRVNLLQYDVANVVIDPRLAFGQPVVANRGVRVEDIADMFFAGDSIQDVGDEYGVGQDVVQAVVRAYPRAAA